jgi:hypothetical protein
MVTLGKGRRASENQTRFENVLGAFWRRRFSLHFLEERFEGKFRQFRLRHLYCRERGSQELLHADNPSRLVDLAGYGCRRYLSSSGDVANVRVSSFTAGIFSTKVYVLRSFPNGGLGQQGGGKALAMVGIAW